MSHGLTIRGANAHTLSLAATRSQTMPQPKTKAEDVINALNAARRRRDLTELDIKRLEREARAVMDIDRVQGAILMGGVASLKADLAGARRWLDQAVGLAPFSSYVLFNYAASLLNFGRLTEATEYAERAFECLGQDGTSLEASNIDFGRIFMSAGKFRKATDFAEISDEFLAYLDQHQLDDDDLECYVKSVEAVLDRGEVCLSGAAMSVLIWEESEVLNLDYIILADPKRTADLNWELAKELAVRDIPTNILDKVSVGFSPQWL